MQRWIAAGVVAMLLLFGGGWLAYRSYKQSLPHPIWVPLPLNPALPVEKRDVLVKELQAKLGERGILVKVSKDVGLTQKWHLASDEEGARELGQRLFVKVGEADTPQGKVPAVLIGVRGTVKETVVSGEIAMRLMEDVWKILGIKPPPK